MIKVCGVKDMATATVAVEAGATAIGLVFAESPRQVTLRAAAEIAHVMHGKLEVVGVFRAGDLGRLSQVLDVVNLSAIQVHGTNDLPLKMHGRDVLPGAPADQLAAFPHRRVLVDAPQGGGRGQSWNYELVREVTGTRDVVLAGGLAPDNVAAAIAAAQPYGVDVSSGVESSRGVKDAGRICEFVAAAKEALAAKEIRA